MTKHKLNIKCEIFSSDRWLPCLNWRLGHHEQPHPGSVLPAPQACRRPCRPAHLSHPSKQQQHIQIHTAKNVPTTTQHRLYHHGSSTVLGGGVAAPRPVQLNQTSLGVLVGWSWGGSSPSTRVKNTKMWIKGRWRQPGDGRETLGSRQGVDAEWIPLLWLISGLLLWYAVRR